MENFQGNFSKATKIKVPPGMKTQKLIIGSGRYHSSSVSPTNFDSENIDLQAPILRYLCGGSPLAGKLAPRGSRSPLSAVENLIERSPSPPAVYRTPVKAVEGEEVLVMDGVPLRRSSRFSGSESSGSTGKSLFKAEIFQSPEDSGKCPYASKSQFARGKEDDRPTSLGFKNKTEVVTETNPVKLPTLVRRFSNLIPSSLSLFLQPQSSKSYHNIPGLGLRSPDSLFLPQIVAPTSAEATMAKNQRTSNRTKPGPLTQISASAAPFLPRAASSSTSTQMSASAAPFIPGQRPVPATRPTSPGPPSRNMKSTPTAAKTFNDWSPLDDGIEVSLPCSSPGKSSSRESVHEHFNKVLSGCKARRLPVFSEIFSE